jgi:RNA 2',3'-cyclic 3'-phosphodiesterase
VLARLAAGEGVNKVGDMGLPERVRCFVAVRLDEAILRRLAGVQEAVCAGLSGLRPVAPEAMHLTCKFLGEIPQTDLGRAFDIVETAAATENAFESVVGGLGIFPPRGRPRVVWVGMSDPDGSLERLNGILDRDGREIGVRAENRRYTPHVTLARIRDPRRASGLEERLSAISSEALGIQDIDEIALVMSELRPEGARYSDLGRARLRPA